MWLTSKLISEYTPNSNFSANHGDNENDQDNENHEDNEKTMIKHVQSQQYKKSFDVFIFHTLF